MASPAVAHYLELVDAHIPPWMAVVQGYPILYICATESVACLALKELTLWRAEELIDASRNTLKVAKAALAVPEGALIAAEQGVIAAQASQRS